MTWATPSDGGAAYRARGDSAWSEAIDGRRDWVRLDTAGRPTWVLREVESGNIIVTPGSGMEEFKVDMTDMNGQAYVRGLAGTPREPLVITGADLPRGRYVVQVTAGDMEFKLYVRL